MYEKKAERILTSVKAPLDHPAFYAHIFALAAKEKRTERLSATDEASLIATEEYEELSRRLDRSTIQESCAVRNVYRSRRLAQLLIDDKGEIKHSLLPGFIIIFEKHLYSLGPSRQFDVKRQQHILKVLQLLHTHKDIVFLLKKFSRPYSNRWAEDLIRQTLLLSPSAVVTDAHTKQAALAAWFCYLRQNVGSCFATAPAEIVHR